MNHEISKALLASAFLAYASGAHALPSGVLPAFAEDAAQAHLQNAPRRMSAQDLLQSSSLVRPDASDIQTNSTTWTMSAQTIATTVFHWDGVSRGAGAVIGIVDSGIDLDHPEFVGRVLTGACFGGYSTICSVAGAMQGGDPGVYRTQKTHGTHVAGIAAGKTVGLANQAKILPVKVCDTYTEYCPGDANAGIIWASKHGANVINLSLGGPGLFAGDIATAATAIANGALLVVAAGNAGKAKPVSGYMGGAALKNGVRGGMVVVGSIGSTKLISDFSQTPGSTCETYGTAKYCMRDYYVVAPGQAIKSSVGGGKYATMSGTSMATPYVSGVAALIKGKWSSLTPYQIADIIFRTADDLGAVGPDNIYGRGAVNVAAAMSPVGGDAVIAATGGTSLTTAMGPSGTLGTTSVGVLSAALAQSAALKSVVVVDAYGRDFSADLTKLAQTPGMSLAGLMKGAFNNVTPFAISEDSAIGRLNVSGAIVTSRAPLGLSANAALESDGLKATEHMAVSFAPADGVSFDFGRNLNMSGYFNAYDLGSARNGENVFLSASALNSPYAALTGGGAFSGASFSPVEGVKLRLGYASSGKRPPLAMAGGSAFDPASTPLSMPHARANAALASMAWDFAPWGGVAVTASRTTEKEAVLGGFTSGAFAAADQAHTGSVGISARIGLGKGWTTTLAWNEGVTRLDLANHGLITHADPLKSRAYGVAITKAGLFGDNDMAGLAITRPLHVYSGNADLHAATAVDADKNLVFSDEHLSLAASRPETNVELGYGAKFLGGALSVQTSAAYQHDVGGQAGKNAIAVLSRASLQF